MILSLSRRWVGGKNGFWLYKASLLHDNVTLTAESSTATEAIKFMAEAVKDQWAETSGPGQPPSDDARKENP